MDDDIYYMYCIYTEINIYVYNIRIYFSPLVAHSFCNFHMYINICMCCNHHNNIAHNICFYTTMRVACMAIHKIYMMLRCVECGCVYMCVFSVIKVQHISYIHIFRVTRRENKNYCSIVPYPLLPLRWNIHRFYFTRVPLFCRSLFCFAALSIYYYYIEIFSIFCFVPVGSRCFFLHIFAWNSCKMFYVLRCNAFCRWPLACMQCRYFSHAAWQQRFFSVFVSIFTLYIYLYKALLLLLLF